MAKYAQGFERKNSDTKNLIIMGAAIIAIILLVIGGVVLYNKVKKEDLTFSSDKYSEYYLGEAKYSKLLDQKDANYYIYVCSKSGTDDDNMSMILEYIDEYEEGKVSTKLYLLDYDEFDSTSDEDETENQETIEEELGYAVKSGYLIAVVDGELTNTSKQVTTDSSKISKEIKSLIKGKTNFEELYK